MSFWKKRPQTKTAYGAVKKEVWRNLLLLPGPFLWLSRTDTCCSSITLSNLAFPTTWRENYCNLIGEESKAGNYLRFARLVSGQTKIRRQVCVFAPAPLIFCWHTLLPERGVNLIIKGYRVGKNSWCGCLKSSGQDVGEEKAPRHSMITEADRGAWLSPE